MDLPSLTQLESLWPDVARPFDEVVPAGCRLARTEEEWKSGLDAFRRRRIELAREPGAPSLEELIEETSDDAFRIGWTPLDEGGFELENVILTVASIEERLAVEFHQPWPADHGCPVETSEMFQNLVRKLLRLGADPERLSKRVIVSPLEIMTADLVEETVEMACEEELSARFDELGFQRVDDDWTSKEITKTHEITAYVRKEHAWVRVRMRKARLMS